MMLLLFMPLLKLFVRFTFVCLLYVSCLLASLLFMLMLSLPFPHTAMHFMLVGVLL